MLLTNLVEKNFSVRDSIRGVCKGIGISLKSCNVKYLLGASSKNNSIQDFAVNISSIEKISDSIQLSKFRSCFPSNCVKIFLNMPIYAYDGSFVGRLLDVELEHFIAQTIITDTNLAFPFSSISACLDAIILKKEQLFPIGQRVPAPFVLDFFHENTPKIPLVTKPLLKKAVEQGSLIKLTLSLPPFSFQEKKTASFLNGIFRRNL